ncbi:MAG: proton-conducting transporter membrane subunit [Lachnospiraceae bacterium]|nr:proton-conducting transporter membrane subunit [Lachnospiraceae bacterium]
MFGDIEVLIAVLFPFAAAFVSYLLGRVSKTGRDRFLQLSVIAELLLIAWCVSGYFQRGMLEYTVNDFCMQGLYFKMDGFRVLYGSIAALMWMMTGIFSREYFAHYRNRNRYYLFYLITLGATVGVFLSGDLYTTFIFFEIMSLTSFVWVVHDEKEAAMKAGNIYLAIAIIGGMVLLMGLFLLHNAVGTLRMDELHEAVSAVMATKSVQIYAAGACMLLGFGAKAGMFPVHIWLPMAHPVAPAPASALLSGILTKSGVFGVLIVSAEIFRHDPAWGMLILILGVVTMFGGALIALFSVDLKRTLACSSMSQIGFILVGTGMMELLGEENALAVRGTILHMVNHSMIKLVLFMVAGVVYMNLHALDLNEIRGFGKRKPLLKGMFLMGALSIGGVPGWSGYVSKTLLHESIVEFAEELIHHGEPATWIHVIEWIFLLTGGMTLAYMTKLFVAVFLEENLTRQKEFDAKKKYMNAESMFAIGVPTLLLVILGFFPYLTMNRLADLAQGFLYGEAPEHAVHYFSLVNLKGAVISLIIGSLIYFGFIRTCLMEKNEKGQKEYISIVPNLNFWEELLHQPGLKKVCTAVVASAAGLIDHMNPMLFLVDLFLTVTAFLSRVCDHFVDAVVLFFRSTTHRSRTEQHLYLIGTKLSRTLGRILDRFVKVLNYTFFRANPIEKSFVVTFAEWEELIKKTNRIFSVSLSFGLFLTSLGLAFTMIYLLASIF